MSTVDAPTDVAPFSLEGAKQIELSIVVPMYDEVDSVQELYVALTDSLGQLAKSYELIVVDDGSGTPPTTSSCGLPTRIRG